MAEYKQHRIQLSFRPSNPEHQLVYQYLKTLPDKTDYIISLVIQDIKGGSAFPKCDGSSGDLPTRFPAAMPLSVQPPEIDYEKLAETLRPTLNDMVNQSLRTAFSGFMGIPAAPTATSAPAPTATSAPAPAAKPKSLEEDDNLSLAMEGLEAFGITRGGKM